MREIIPVLISVLILGLFLYSKLLPFKDRLNPQYRKVFDFFNSIFQPVFKFLKKTVKPFKVGNGLSVDMSQIVILIVLLFLLNIL